MLMSSSIFIEKDLTEAFFALDTKIEEAAQATDGFLGKESWVSPDGAKRNSVYYWADATALRSYSSPPLHLEAKSKY